MSEEKRESSSRQNSTEGDVEKIGQPGSELQARDQGVLGNEILGENSTERSWSWDEDPSNPYNWSKLRKAKQVFMIASLGFTASIASSIVSPSHSQIMEEFGVDTTQSILPLSLYVFAMALGPVIGGPLSETVGRYPIYLCATPLGALFTLGAGFTHSFAGLCILRFLAGLCWGPTLSVPAGTLNETFRTAERALPSALFIMTPFMGPGIAPVIGAFVTNRKGWRWTQWTIDFFAVFAFLVTLAGEETSHTILRRRREKELGLPVDPVPPLAARIKVFMSIALVRPIRMLFTEPIVSLICLYVACEFATLFSFFAAFPYVFQGVYHFGIEDAGLVFIPLVVGSFLGMITIMVCERLLYQKQVPKYPPHKVPPEHRLYGAMIGSLGLPISLFWFAWTSRADISWASPVVAVVPFAWGNVCVFISTTQFMVDTYTPRTVASAMSANSLARYGLAGAFPLFTIQMYQRLGIGWATSLLGFIALALLPVPWAFFRFGKSIRAMSRFETADR